MSDALTDIARDQKRTAAAEDYIRAVLAYVQVPRSPSKAPAVIACAQRCDNVPRGFWQGSINFASCAERTLRGLRDGDLVTWAKTLRLASHLFPWGREVISLIALSPWPGKKMMEISFDRWRQGTLAELLEEPMHAAGNGTTFHGNPSGYFTYVVFWDKESTLLQIAQAAVCIDTHCTEWSVPTPGRGRLGN
jgi:hypothetical protein